jgi:hypothetical protein
LQAVNPTRHAHVRPDCLPTRWADSGRCSRISTGPCCSRADLPARSAEQPGGGSLHRVAG